MYNNIYMRFNDGRCDSLNLQIVSNLLCLKESAIPYLNWYSPKPLSVAGKICIQLNFTNYPNLRTELKTHHNLIHIEDMNYGPFVVAFFEYPKYE